MATAEEDLSVKTFSWEETLRRPSDEEEDKAKVKEFIKKMGLEYSKTDWRARLHKELDSDDRLVLEEAPLQSHDSDRYLLEQRLLQQFKGAAAATTDSGPGFSPADAPSPSNT